MSGGGDFVQRGENDIVKIEINVLNLRKSHLRDHPTSFIYGKND
jgi:hypothetical protein